MPLGLSATGGRGDGPPWSTQGRDGQASAAKVAAHATGGPFLNFLADPSRTHTAFTAANHARLRELKLVHDPENVFGLAKNIPPVDREPARRVARPNRTGDRSTGVGTQRPRRRP
ncbi:BBE domain-containing protein [Actinophytocola oryzae]|uniref:Berberine-like enzyme n=1 Tax=Actinophytocola oryzae TaxID=502181 RepID=A0A4R7V644_9PSEU|nr:BBE domain-containing protein [Actinophytocola oryzae]TDV44958.1 berberine-like enzyme [Actinophytocola oryzae]